MSQEELAFEVGLSSQHLSRVERGVSDPSLATLKRICHCLQTDLVDLFLFAFPDTWPDGSGRSGPQDFSGCETSVSSPSGMITFDDAGKVQFSSGAYRLMGHNPGSFYPTLNRFIKMVIPEDRPLCRDFFQNHVSQNKPVEIVVRLMRKGSQVTLKLCRDVIWSKESDSKRILFLLTDLSGYMVLRDFWIRDRQQLEEYVNKRNLELSRALESYQQELERRKKYEHELKISERMVSGSADGLAFLCAEAKFKVVNKSFEEIFSLTRKAVVGKNYLEVMKNRFRDTQCLKPIEQNILLALKGVQVQFEQWIEDTFNRTVFICVKHVPLIEKGILTGIIVSVQDMTDQRMAEESCKRIVETITETILEVNSRLEISFANENVSELLGYDPKSMSGLSLLELVHPQDVNHVEESIKKANDHTGSSRFEARFIHRNGSLVLVHVCSSRLFDGTGSFLGATVMVVNLGSSYWLRKTISNDALIT